MIQVRGERVLSENRMKRERLSELYLNSLLVSIVNRVFRSGTMKYQCDNTDESNKKWLLT